MIRFRKKFRLGGPFFMTTSSRLLSGMKMINIAKVTS